MRTIRYMLTLCISLLLFSSCEKFLSEKSDKRLVIPSDLKYLQGLLDNEQGFQRAYVTVGEMSATDFFIPDDIFNGSNIDDYDRNLYLWKGEDIYDSRFTDWEKAYEGIYSRTLVLSHLDDINRTSQNAIEWDHIKGQALALRAYQYLSNAAAWSKAYDPATAATDLGIPFRNMADFNEPSVRSSVKETYEKILIDLKQAIPLLPNRAEGISRASKPMAYATLARTYLWMRDYTQARLYADSAFQINKELLDYNGVAGDVFSEPVIGYFNPEILFYTEGINSAVLHALPIHRIDTLLYSQFEDRDLRKRLFFIDNADGYASFNGNYTGSEHNRFNGISNAEVYLMLAECYAREGKVAEAMNKLNALLVNRYDKNEAFEPRTASSKEEALDLVLKERRKELLFRGLRWMDIKRLNKEGANIVLTRKVNGETYTLPPNDNRYALPLPEDIIELSGMPQNPQ